MTLPLTIPAGSRFWFDMGLPGKKMPTPTGGTVSSDTAKLIKVRGFFVTSQ